MKNELNKLMGKIRRLNQRGLIRRATYSNNIRFLQLQTEGGLVLDDVEHIEPFGFTSHPLPDAEAVVLSFKGNGSHSVAILVDDKRFKLKIAPGEVAIFNRHGDKVQIRDDRIVEIKAEVINT